MIKNNVINVLRNEYEEWILSLTDAEIKAIRKYSYNSMDSKPNRFFERLNAMLRGDYNRNDKEMLKEYADIISSALCRHPLEHDIICYRGTDVDPTLNIKTGTIFTFDQFISTSVVKNKALKRKYLYMIKAVEGTKGAYRKN